MMTMAVAVAVTPIDSDPWFPLLQGAARAKRVQNVLPELHTRKCLLSTAPFLSKSKRSEEMTKAWLFKLVVAEDT